MHKDCSSVPDPSVPAVLAEREGEGDARGRRGEAVGRGKAP
jgi:hypothetical protein